MAVAPVGISCRSIRSSLMTRFGTRPRRPARLGRLCSAVAPRKDEEALRPAAGCVPVSYGRRREGHRPRGRRFGPGVVRYVQLHGRAAPRRRQEHRVDAVRCSTPSRPAPLTCASRTTVAFEGVASIPSSPRLSVQPKTLVVFSHLRWSFVFQRPQHLLTRLAAHYRVLFIEEPIQDDGAPRLESVPGMRASRSSGRTPP